MKAENSENRKPKSDETRNDWQSYGRGSFYIGLGIVIFIIGNMIYNYFFR